MNMDRKRAVYFWRPALFLRHIMVFVRFGKSLAGIGQPAQHASAKRKGERMGGGGGGWGGGGGRKNGRVGLFHFSF